VTSLDEEFMRKIIEVIETNIDDPSFTVKELCEAMNVSHASLYRKVKSLTDQTVIEFVRGIRIKRAAQLFRNKGISISEVAYSTGFNSRSYFSQVFQEMYGLTPKQYYNKIHETPEEEGIPKK
jgi:AraC-like DNA-binding protein